MNISSSAFNNYQKIPSAYTCDGDDISPPLVFSGVPDGAKSLALVVDDPDAPAGNWTHWLVWNIDPKTREIPEDNVPEGAVLGITSAGTVGYHGPCPPGGEHRYFFKLFALDSVLDLQANSGKSELESEIRDHLLAECQLVGLYSKNS